MAGGAGGAGGIREDGNDRKDREEKVLVSDMACAQRCLRGSHKSDVQATLITISFSFFSPREGHLECRLKEITD